MEQGQGQGGPMPGSSNQSQPNYGGDQFQQPSNKMSTNKIIAIVIAILVIGAIIYAAVSQQPEEEITNTNESEQASEAGDQPADGNNEPSGDLAPNPNPPSDNEPAEEPVEEPIEEPLAECIVSGCNNEVCTTPDNPVFSACVWQEKYTCYNTAVCEKQIDGQCGWTMSPELTVCLDEKK